MMTQILNNVFTTESGKIKYFIKCFITYFRGSPVTLPVNGKFPSVTESNQATREEPHYGHVTTG